MKSLKIALLAGAILWPGMAQTQPSAPAKVAITIYNENLAMVRENRDMDIRAGEQRLEFRGVSAQIRPETVAIAGGGGLTVIEQNFDYDLLTPSKLLEKAVGQKVRIVRVNPGNGQEVSETAEVLAVNDGAVLRIGDRIEVLRDGGLPARVIFDSVPANLRDRPTLSVLVEARQAGRRGVDLAYLTGGLSWKADYVGQWDETTGNLQLQGWITLSNSSGVAYENALTQLVAGDLNRVREQPQMVMAEMARAMPAPAMARQEQLGDYHLYTLPRPTTIQNNQTKQVAFLDAPQVKAAKAYAQEVYGFNTQRDPMNVNVQVRFSNVKASGLGLPLPGGVVRLYGKDSAGRAQFIGEDGIRHTAEGLGVDLNLGRAFDVTVQSKLIRANRLGERLNEYQIEYQFKNARGEPVSIEFDQSGLGGDWQISGQTIPFEKQDFDTARFQVQVPAKGQAKLSFTARIYS